MSATAAESQPQVPAQNGCEVSEEVKSDEIASGKSDPHVELMDSAERSNEHEIHSDKVETEAETSTTTEQVTELQQQQEEVPSSDEKVQQSADVRLISLIATQKANPPSLIRKKRFWIFSY